MAITRLFYTKAAKNAKIHDLGSVFVAFAFVM
jgi:hypothetical protein